MTCYLSKDDWHSYYKKSLSKSKLEEMSNHLALCLECRNNLLQIQETANVLAAGRTALTPPEDLKLNIMKAIDKHKYQIKPSSIEKCEQQPSTAHRNLDTYDDGHPHKTANSPLFELRNWGFSMVAAGFLLFTLNLSPLTHYLTNTQVALLNNELNKQIALPLNRINQLTHTLITKIDSLAP
ncbi:hypothetical protein Desaci_1055 [Desulfosporosinus acidiphilus SJ4]|uniref:Zinc-finger domain-containing protein n=1 Tax=Desulfosporosinus acidiphilus (strain DSM 22704 / JCM 16185 / SJ4) TaxID=646529 RepID=I4D2S0_DESAJ|nr:hypothetical protein [Desulfosporosinus acidiphilus]AFM40094.1 hypothetical protein Desaci_1055 [Desulfosporosinus acidiphilus SJ4]